MGKQQPGPKVRMRKEGKAESEERRSVEVREDKAVFLELPRDLI